MKYLMTLILSAICAAALLISLSADIDAAPSAPAKRRAAAKIKPAAMPAVAANRPGVRSDTATKTIRLPLYKLVPVRTVDLKCLSAERSIQIPIPERWNIKKVILSFDYVNSTGLLAGKSRMGIKLNNYPVSQINLNPLAPEGSVKLSLPNFLFESGYNDLAFSVSQHYSLECEQACAADLWTTLKLDEAFVEIEYSLKPVPLKLASTSGFLFDPKMTPMGEVNIVMKNTNADMVTIAGIVASGIARRFDYKKVSFTTSSDIKPGYDNILLGSKDFLQKFLQSKGLKPLQVPGPLLKIMHLPAAGSGAAPAAIDPTHALIVVSGINADQMKLAAETLAIVSSSYPNSDEMIVTEFRLPDIPMYGGKLIVTSDKKYTFKTLNFDTHTFKGINPAPKELVFRLPADFLIKPNIYVDISLYYAFGAAIRSDSALNIKLNGGEVRALHLDNAKGDLIEGYKIRIPTYMFKPGDNILRFEPVMSPYISKACEGVQTENLFLTIFDKSTLMFPQMPHFAELPNLSLFMLNGFPYTRWPDGHDSTIYLTGKDFNTINSALNLVGMITQKNGYPLFEFQYTYEDPKKFPGDLIIVGDIPSIPKEYKQAAPLTLTKETTVPYPLMRSWKDEKSLAYSKQISSFKTGKGALMEFLSPYTEGRTVLLMTAPTTEDLLTMSDAVTDSVVQAQSIGDLVLVDLVPENLERPEYKVSALSVGKKYFSGKTGDVSIIDRYLYFYPWLYYLAVVLVVIALTLLIFFLLKKYRKKRQKGASGEGDM